MPKPNHRPFFAAEPVRAAARALAVAFLGTGALALPPVQTLVTQVARVLEFRARTVLGRDPGLDPRVQIYAYDDLAIDQTGAPAPTLTQWADVIEAFARTRPRAIVIDKIFGYLERGDDPETFRAQLAKVPAPLYVGGVIAATRLPRRQPLDLTRSPQMTPGAALPTWPGLLYGPDARLGSGFTGIGHIHYQGNGEVLPVIALAGGALVPHLGIAPFPWRADPVLRIGDDRVPVDADGAALLDLASAEVYQKRTRSLRPLFERIGRGDLTATSTAGDIVVILPSAYTGNADFLATPAGTMLGGHALAALLSSALTGHWLRPASRGLPAALIALAAAMASALCGWRLQPRIFWAAMLAGAAAASAAGLGAFAFQATELPWLGPLGVFWLTGISAHLRRLRRDRDEQLRLGAELAMAKAVQTMLLPPGGRVVAKRLTVVGRCETASEVGGDWWWHTPGQDGVELLAVGDVTGHGARAAMLAAWLAGAHHAHRTALAASGESLRPGAMLTHMSSLLHSGVSGGRASLFVTAIDFRTATLTFASAGHPAAFILRGGGRGCTVLKARGSLIGHRSGGAFEELSVAFAPGDRLVLLSDGLTEAEDALGRPFGRGELIRLLQSLADAPAEDFVTRVFATLAKRRRGALPQRDDMTLVVADLDQYSVPDRFK